MTPADRAPDDRFLALARDFGIAQHDSVFTDDLPTFELIRAEQDNLVQALRHGLDRRDAATVAAVSAVLGGLWMAEGVSPADRPGRGHDPDPASGSGRGSALVEATRTSLVLGAVTGILFSGPGPARFRRAAPAAARSAGHVRPGCPGRAERIARAARGGPCGPASAGREDQPLVAGAANYVTSYAREEAGDTGGALAAARRSLAAFEPPQRAAPGRRACPDRRTVPPGGRRGFG